MLLRRQDKQESGASLRTRQATGPMVHNYHWLPVRSHTTVGWATGGDGITRTSVQTSSVSKRAPPCPWVQLREHSRHGIRVYGCVKGERSRIIGRGFLLHPPLGYRLEDQSFKGIIGPNIRPNHNQHLVPRPASVGTDWVCSRTAANSEISIKNPKQVRSGQTN